MTGVLDKIAARIDQVLASSAISVRLKVTGRYDESGRMAGAFWFVVRSSERIEGIHNYSEVFAELGKALTDEFGTELGTSIAIDAPPELCGPAAVLRRTERDELKSEFGKVKWKDTQNG